MVSVKHKKLSLKILHFAVNNDDENWPQEELQKLDSKMRQLLSIHGHHYPKADADCLYFPRKQVGRGLMRLEETYILEITKMLERIDSKENPPIQIFRMHQHNFSLAVLQTAICIKRELQRGTRQIKDSTVGKTKERWRGNVVHGIFPHKLD